MTSLWFGKIANLRVNFTTTLTAFSLLPSHVRKSTNFLLRIKRHSFNVRTTAKNISICYFLRARHTLISSCICCALRFLDAEASNCDIPVTELTSNGSLAATAVLWSWFSFITHAGHVMRNTGQGSTWKNSPYNNFSVKCLKFTVLLHELKTPWWNRVKYNRMAQNRMRSKLI